MNKCLGPLTEHSLQQAMSAASALPGPTGTANAAATPGESPGIAGCDDVQQHLVNRYIETPAKLSITNTDSLVIHGTPDCTDDETL